VFHQHSRQTNTNHNSCTSLIVPVPDNAKSTQNQAHTIIPTRRLNKDTPKRYQPKTISSGKRHRQLPPPPINIPPRDTHEPRELTDNERSNYHGPSSQQINSPPRRDTRPTTIRTSLYHATRTTSQTVTWREVKAIHTTVHTTTLDAKGYVAAGESLWAERCHYTYYGHNIYIIYTYIYIYIVTRLTIDCYYWHANTTRHQDKIRNYVTN